ncbi:MAG TPA: tRNA epoxyqueuosine(34) reductase QueG [Bacteroidales bacterium]|nr:tRNA epoxyqueuosine(34) reductase QueG [Bacteroidales bacterium]
MDTREFSLEIKKQIFDTGAADCGFARVETLQREYDFLLQWTAEGLHAGKTYLERNPEVRADPALLVPGAKTIIAVLYNYYTGEKLTDQLPYRISNYAFGADYHKVLNEKLAGVAAFIKQQTESENTRICVDTSPIFEKAWAQRAGLGWIGKNSLLVSEKTGTFHFIAVLVTDVVLNYDTPLEEKCGSCTLCLDACPTGALLAPHKLDVRKCISHLTMEQKNPLPESLRNKFNGFIYGCDYCQEACPWNKHLKPTAISEFQLSVALKKMTAADWETLTEEKFLDITQDSAMRRVGFQTLQRNIRFIKEKND